MSQIVSIEGPVEMVNGEFALRIPLSAGGEHLAECARGIGHIEGDFLLVVIPSWLAKKLGISEGSRVVVNNQGGKFNISPSKPDS